MHYNEILRFRRGKMYGLLTVYAIFVDGFEMQALNHVWSGAGLDPKVRIITHM